MEPKKAIEAIESGNLIEAHSMIEKSLNNKAGAALQEKKKSLAVKTWGKSRESVISEDSKSIQSASRRKAFREKMQKIKKVSK
jgi:hypothetical protein